MLKIKGFQADALNSLRSNTKSSSHLHNSDIKNTVSKLGLMHDCLKNKPIQKRKQVRERFWLFAKRLKSLDCVGFHFLQEGMEP
jgi:hypothetical protein